MRQITETELEDIALGAAVLGAGGGGDPYIGKLLAREAIRAHGPVQVHDVAQVPREALIIPTAMMGAPTVMVEKLPGGHEAVNALDALVRHLGREATFTMPVEIGGINSMLPICLAAQAELPIVDADLMGRAFPELQMCLPTLFGISTCPMTIADEKGNVAIIEAAGNHWAERLARSLTIDMGCTALIAEYPLRGLDLKRATIGGTLGLAEELGRLVRSARAAHGDPTAALVERLHGYQLFEGKVVDVHRRTEGGFARALVQVEGLGSDEGSMLLLRAQNENLVAERGDDVVASVPDLIAVLDSETGQPITTEELRYGFRVKVASFPCDPRWRSEAGLEIVGPRYFGYDFDYVPIEERAAALA